MKKSDKTYNCKDCGLISRKEWYPSGRRKYNGKCEKCFKEDIKQYNKEYYQREDVKQRKKEYLQREDVKQRKKEYLQREDVKQRRREIDLKKKYALNPEQYESMREDQADLCAICNKPEQAINGITGKVKNLAIDHNHASGAIRGLLCSRCNVGIGHFQDNTDIIQAAYRYLNYHNHKNLP